MSAFQTTFSLLLVIFGLAIASYYGMKMNKEKNRQQLRLLENRLMRAKNELISGGAGDYLISAEIALLDTRRNDGRDVLRIIDLKGKLVCNGKGLHYIGANRRLSWEWNKIMEVRTKAGNPSSVQIVVSNRQKISGISISGNYSVSKKIIDFINWGQNINFERAKKTTTKSSSPNQKEEINVTYNIVQNVQDSVIQGNFELRKD